MDRFWRIYRLPLGIALISLVGLTLGLVYDGVGDVVSWSMLGIAIWPGVYYACRRR